MILALAFIACALVAAWLPDHAWSRKPVTALAGGLGVYGMAAHGWVGWRWDWQAWWTLLVFILCACAVLVAVYHDRFSPRLPLLDDLAWGVVWGALQQGVLLGFLLQVHPVVALAAFPLMHAPNVFLTALTAVAGAASILTAEHVGLSIPAAAVAHAFLSLIVSLGLPREVHGGMCVGRDCEEGDR